MKKIIALILAALLALSMLTAATAATYTDKDTVKKVQQALNDAGYNCGTPDGVAGKKTAAAITQYQTDKGLEATGTIDDALLEAMGIEKAGDSEQAENAPEAVDSSDIAVQLHDFGNIAYYYNLNFLYRLAYLGVDVENEDIGQGSYIIKNVEQAWGTTVGYCLNTEPFRIYYMPAEEELSISFEDEDKKELSFLDHAAVFAFMFTIQDFFVGSEQDWNNLVSLLGDAPSKDGTVPIADNMIELNGDEFRVEGKNVTQLSASRPLNYKSDSWKTGDDVPAIPDDLVGEMGGLPETLDKLWPRYDLIENVHDGGTSGSGCSTDKYKAYLSVRRNNDGGVVVTLHAMDDQYNYQTWFGVYDKDLKLIEKRYVDACSEMALEA